MTISGPQHFSNELRLARVEEKHSLSDYTWSMSAAATVTVTAQRLHRRPQGQYRVYSSNCMWLIRLVFFCFFLDILLFSAPLTNKHRKTKLSTSFTHKEKVTDIQWTSRYFHFEPTSKFHPQSSLHSAVGWQCSFSFSFFKCLPVNLTNTHLCSADKMLLLCTSSYWLKIRSCSFFSGPRGCFPLRRAPLTGFCCFLQKSPQLTSGHVPAWSLQLNGSLRLQSFQTLEDKSVGNTCQSWCQKLPGKKNTAAVDGLSLIFPHSLCWHNFPSLINFCVVLTFFFWTHFFLLV